jgi:lambda family phage tail tape measure protein
MAAGSIVVDLLMRTGSFETDTARARKSLAKFEKEAIQVGKVVATAFTVVATAAAAVVQSQINAADAASKAAQSAGISSEAYTALSYAADLAGVNQETLSKVFSKLNTDIATNDKLLRSMGIALQDSTGKARTADAVLEELAGSFSTMRDGAEKSAVAAKIFGERFGPQMVPFLNQGKEGIKALKDEAAKLGIVISTDTGKKAEEFNDNMTRLKTAVQGAAQTITEQLLPTLVKVSERLVQNVKDIGLFQGAFVTLFQSLFGGTDPQDILRERLAKTQTSIASFKEELEGLAVGGKADTKRFSVLAEELAKLEKQAELTTKEIGVFDKMAELARPKAPSATGAPPSLIEPKKAKKEIDEVKKALDELEKELALFGQDDSFKKAFEFEGLKGLDKLGPTNAELERYRANLKELQRIEAFAEVEKMVQALVKESKELGLSNDQLIIRELVLKKADAAQLDAAKSALALRQAFNDTKALREAQAAADDYINSLKRASEAEIQLIGKGAKERQRINGRLAMEDRFEEQRRALNRSRIDASLSPGGFGPEQQRRYEQELEIIRATQAEALKIYDATYQQRMQMEADWQVGMSEAANDYITNASNIAAQTNDLFTNAFQGMEDALVKFVTTGKLDFKSLANSILVDITRIIIKQTIMNALMSAFGMGSTGPIGFASVAGISGGRADGGPVEAGKSYFVGERGPEIFSPNTSGTILPNGVMPKGQAQQIIHITVPVQGMVDRRTREQIASTVAMELGRSRSRATA